jgi:hypothetical protein
MGLTYTPRQPANLLVDEDDYDFLETAMAKEPDVPLDTPFGSNSSMLTTMASTPPPLHLENEKQTALDSMRPRPVQGKPKMWQRILAGAVGGAAGYVNAGGRVRVDPSAAVEGIYAGNTPHEQEKWDRDYGQAARAAQAEQRQNSQKVAGYNAEAGYRRALATEQAAGSRAALDQARLKGIEQGEYRPIGNGAAIHSKGGQVVNAPPQPPAYVRPGFGYPVKGPNGETTYKVQIPAEKKAPGGLGLVGVLPENEQGPTAKRMLESQINRNNRGPAPRASDDPDAKAEKAYGTVKKEKDAAYAKAENDRKSELDRLSRDYNARIAAAKKAGKTQEMAALQAEKDTKVKQTEESHVRRKNAIEMDAVERRKQLGLSSSDTPGGKYNKKTGDWVPGDLQAPASIEAGALTPGQIEAAAFKKKVLGGK